MSRTARRPREAALASLPRRLAAFGIDYLVVALYMGALSLVALGAGRVADLEGLWSDPVRGQLLGFLLLTLPVVLYFAASEHSRRQATVGKRVLGLRVVSASGARLSWSRALVRSAVKFAPWELAHACLWRIPGWPDAVESVPSGVVVGLSAVWLLVALYLLVPLVSRERQTPYDWAAGSVVVDDARTGAVRADVSVDDR